MISDCRVWNNAGPTCSNCGGVACDVCFTSTVSDISVSDNCGGQATINSGCWASPACVAHELAHLDLCIDDEYGPDDPACLANSSCERYCGHTMMSLPHAGQNNFCIRHDGSFTNHLKDWHVGAPSIPCTGLPCARSSWDWAVEFSNKVYAEPTSTPDNYSYESHDFNDVIQCVLQP